MVAAAAVVEVQKEDGEVVADIAIEEAAVVPVRPKPVAVAAVPSAAAGLQTPFAAAVLAPPGLVDQHDTLRLAAAAAFDPGARATAEVHIADSVRTVVVVKKSPFRVVDTLRSPSASVAVVAAPHLVAVYAQGSCLPCAAPSCAARTRPVAPGVDGEAALPSTPWCCQWVLAGEAGCLPLVGEAVVGYATMRTMRVVEGIPQRPRDPEVPEMPLCVLHAVSPPYGWAQNTDRRHQRRQICARCAWEMKSATQM